MNPFLPLKNHLKNLAIQIRKEKKIFKDSVRSYPTYNPNVNNWDNTRYWNWLDSYPKAKHLNLAYHFRHQHIAYCELRGRKREEIEKPDKNNKPDESYIKNIKDEFGKGNIIKQTGYSEITVVSTFQKEAA